MNSICEYTLKGLRKVFYHGPAHIRPFMDPDAASDAVAGLRATGKPGMVARFGSTELNLWTNVLGIRGGRKDVWAFVRGQIPEWWWNRKCVAQMGMNAGFFPLDEDSLYAFADLMEKDVAELDLLGSWRPEERFLDLSGIPKIPLVYMEPFWSERPWTRLLEGKKVLVVHPFAVAIEAQYVKRERLFRNPDILPKFHLRTLRAVQSIGGGTGGYPDWFTALEAMKRQMDAEDYDIALIGCGAYGFPLAAHAKCTGHQAVHLGGSLQLLFGIKGARWEDPSYGVKEWGIPEGFYPSLFNAYWIRPGDALRPANADRVENGCYW